MEALLAEFDPILSNRGIFISQTVIAHQQHLIAIKDADIEDNWEEIHDLEREVDDLREGLRQSRVRAIANIGMITDLRRRMRDQRRMIRDQRAQIATNEAQISLHDQTIDRLWHWIHEADAKIEVLKSEIEALEGKLIAHLGGIPA